MKTFILQLVFTFVFIFNSRPILAFGIFSDVSLDLLNGELTVTPTIPQVYPGYIYTSKSTCWGLCFDSWFSEKRENDDKKLLIEMKNTYFFLSGNPDDLRFHLVNMVCSGKYLFQVNYLSHHIKVLKGEYRVQGHLFASRLVISRVLPRILPHQINNFPGYSNFKKDIIDTTEDYPVELLEDYVNFACSDKYRAKYQAFSLHHLDSTFGDIFNIHFDGTKINVTWDANSWVDLFEQDIQKSLDRATKILNQNNKYLPNTSTNALDLSE